MFEVHWTVIGAVLFIVWTMGLMAGIMMRDGYWLRKVMDEDTPNQTPIRHDGRFFYIIEEGWFCKEYQLRINSEDRTA